MSYTPAPMKQWGGRRVARLVAATLASKGTVCHLCLEPGADSADHDPPRSVLVRDGVPDPDALRFLYPAHLRCNVIRKARPVTPQLRAEIAAARAAHTPPRRSPRFGGPS